jgi:hypothetical protein
MGAQNKAQASQNALEFLLANTTKESYQHPVTHDSLCGGEAGH